MIKDIHRIYIIDKEAKVFYLRENYISDSDSAPVDHALLSRFVGALESFITELGEEKTKIINLGDEKIFVIKDKITAYRFVLCCDMNSKPKKMFKILNNIMNIFISEFTGKFSASEEKRNAMNSFVEEINELLTPRSTIEGLFGTQQ